MKHLYLNFEDATFEQLKEEKTKSGLSWEKFVTAKCLGGKQ